MNTKFFFFFFFFFEDEWHLPVAKARTQLERAREASPSCQVGNPNFREHDGHLPVAKSWTQTLESTSGISQLPSREPKRSPENNISYVTQRCAYISSYVPCPLRTTGEPRDSRPQRYSERDGEDQGNCLCTMAKTRTENRSVFGKTLVGV